MNSSIASPDLMLDTWATCKGPHLSALAAEATARVLEAYTPSHNGNRHRRPKADQVERVSNIVSCLIANLAALHRDSPQSHRLAVPMKHEAATRYDRRGFGSLPKVVRSMEMAGLVTTTPAHIKVRRTGLKATGWLLEALLSPTIGPGEIGRAEGEETIVLTARAGRNGRGEKLPPVYIDYRDTEETLKLQAEMGAINAYLAKQRLELDGEPQANIRLVRRFMLRHPSHPRTFRLHGRLYGGFWQSLPKERRGGIRINGEPIADLDYASMFPRLAYIKVGIEPPEGDLYAIPGLEAHRGGAKIGLSALLSARTPMRRLPADLKAALPEGWTAATFRNAVATKHPGLVSLFGHDIGAELMFTESCILVAVMRSLAEMGIVALPMHDGIMVAAHQAGRAGVMMVQEAEAITGSPLPIVRKH